MVKSKSKKIYAIKEWLDYYLNTANNSKLLAGLAMIAVNIGSKYVEINFTDTQEHYIRNRFLKEMLIFSLVFLSTHDIAVSILMTSAFIVLANYALNENSNLCILPKKYRRLSKAIDTNNDGKVSKKELEKAISILNKVKTTQQ